MLTSALDEKEDKAKPRALMMSEERGHLLSHKANIRSIPILWQNSQPKHNPSIQDSHFSVFIRMERIFGKDIVLSCICDFFFFYLFIYLFFYLFIYFFFIYLFFFYLFIFFFLCYHGNS